jgi:hypothetical protein
MPSKIGLMRAANNLIPTTDVEVADLRLSSFRFPQSSWTIGFVGRPANEI